MTTINARFRIRGVTTGSGAPADHLNREIAANESNNTFWYGFGDGPGDAANASHLMFRSDGTRLWHDIIGASDGSTVFVGRWVGTDRRSGINNHGRGRAYCACQPDRQ
jgi:hypothetical protein